MAGIIDSVRKALTYGTPGYGQVNKALDTAAAASASPNAELKSYQDKYGPSVGQRIYQQDQAAKTSAATAQGQGHMGAWADKMHPTK